MPVREKIVAVGDYDLAATLNSGQAFRWQSTEDAWVGVIGAHWVRLAATECGGIVAETASPVTDWQWLEHYLQSTVDLGEVLASFPDDPSLRAAVTACRGLRLLRQDPWECLASFILSSTKQIVQIRAIIATLCERHGEPLPVPPGHAPAWSFPSAARLSALSESELRACKMGCRAPYLRETARMVANGENQSRRPPPDVVRFRCPRGIAQVSRGLAEKSPIASCCSPTAFRTLSRSRSG